MNQNSDESKQVLGRPVVNASSLVHINVYICIPVFVYTPWVCQEDQNARAAQMPCFHETWVQDDSGSHWLGWRCERGGQMDLYGFVMRAVAHFISFHHFVG